MYRLGCKRGCRCREDVDVDANVDVDAHVHVEVDVDVAVGVDVDTETSCKCSRAGGRPAARPTEEKIMGPNPVRNTIVRIPKKAPWRNFSSDRTPGITGGRRRAGGRPAAPRGRPPDRRFYSCCASGRRPKGGRQIADLFVLCIQEG